MADQAALYTRAASSGGAGTRSMCPQYRMPASALLCAECVHALVAPHRQELDAVRAQVREARARLKGRTLNPFHAPAACAAPRAWLTDPFQTDDAGAAEPSSVARSQARLGARRAQLDAKAADVRRVRARADAVRRRVSALRTELEARRSMLARARAAMERSRSHPQAPAQSLEEALVLEKQRLLGLTVQHCAVAGELQRRRRAVVAVLLDVFAVAPSTGDSPDVARCCWRICALELPTLERTAQVPRHEVNGALFYAAQLLQLLSAYLGVQLPFTLALVAGRMRIRPSSTFPGSLGSSKKTLHLSRAAHAELASTPPSAADAARGYVDAWLMLVYDMVYVALTQGVKPQELAPECSPLWLLHCATHAGQMGWYVARRAARTDQTAARTPACTSGSTSGTCRCRSCRLRSLPRHLRGARARRASRTGGSAGGQRDQPRHIITTGS